MEMNDAIFCKNYRDTLFLTLRKNIINTPQSRGHVIIKCFFKEGIQT